MFDNTSEVIFDREPLKSIRDMTEEDYVPGGCTALINALGSAVKHISSIHKYIREEDVPEKTVFVIITDGMENAQGTKNLYEAVGTALGAMRCSEVYDRKCFDQLEEDARN